MAIDPKIGATLLAEGTARAEFLVNEMLARLLGCLMSVKSSTDTPPGSPTNFDAYIVTATASGAWTGYEGYVAVYVDGWIFAAPKVGMRVWDEAQGYFTYYTGDAWQLDQQAIVYELPVGTRIVGPGAPGYGSWSIDATADSEQPLTGLNWYRRDS